MKPCATLQDWVSALAAEPDEMARRDLLPTHAAFATSDGLVALHAGVVQWVYSDTAKAARLSEAATWLAVQLGDARSLGVAARCRAHAAYAQGAYADAAALYGEAIAQFRLTGDDAERGRTLSSGLQSLIYLGRYQEALEWAEAARVVFEKAGDRLRLVRLKSNTGNIWYRLDRYEEALVCYEEAWRELPTVGDPKDVAAAGSNVAVCRISLGRFPEALQAYQEVRRYCEAHELPLLVAAADYNIAYLHFLRGDYPEAIRLYAATRLHCERAGDVYHAALCDLDESELYLEMNLIPEAAALSEKAAGAFATLGMRYEQAKALAFRGLAIGRKGDLHAARTAFLQARRMFTQEGNALWPAMLDVYHALVLEKNGMFGAALRRAQLAHRALRTAGAPSRLALCDLLRARLLLHCNGAHKARAICRRMQQQIAQQELSPWAAYHCHAIQGRAAEALGLPTEAYAHHQDARAELENLRGVLPVEEWRIALIEDKRETYESLAALCVSGQLGPSREAEAFRLFEQARSRTLFEALLAGGVTAPAGELDSLRAELSACYRQMEEASLRGKEPEARAAWQRCTARCERELLERLAHAQSGHALATADPFDVRNALSYEELRERLPVDTTLLEYANANGQWYACVLTRDRLRVVPLGPVEAVRVPLRLLQFQLARRIYNESSGTPAQLDAATASHLEHLYALLIAPVRSLLEHERLVIAPAGYLHHLPFAALQSGSRCLADDHTISCTPSASVYVACRSRTTGGHGALIAGIPDERAPHIRQEALAAAKHNPRARLLLDQDATLAAFTTAAAESDLIHLATHAVFRPDNPLFSSLRLADGYLSVWETRRLRWKASLAVLSGCGTGRSAVLGGDELMGLVRGFLTAGVRQVVVSLWDVNDRGTAELMSAFHAHRIYEHDPAAALRRAMLQLRETHPHPALWAPFTVIGG